MVSNAGCYAVESGFESRRRSTSCFETGSKGIDDSHSFSHLPDMSRVVIDSNQRQLQCKDKEGPDHPTSAAVMVDFEDIAGQVERVLPRRKYFVSPFANFRASFLRERGCPIKIMAASSSSLVPTPLAHVDNQEKGPGANRFYLRSVGSIGPSLRKDIRAKQ
ncbi:hypothetical protein TNCV_238161 [Trichonephila clavipes]|nr:hypothetical protein TNCV_238161 [Trichonephila clavipes]